MGWWGVGRQSHDRALRCGAAEADDRRRSRSARTSPPCPKATAGRVRLRVPGSGPTSPNPRLRVAICCRAAGRCTRCARRGGPTARVAQLLDAVRLPKIAPHTRGIAVRRQRQRANPARGRGAEPTCWSPPADQRARRVGAGVGARPVRGAAQREWAFACLFISHDLAVVDRVPTTSRLVNGVRRKPARGSNPRNPQTEYTERLVAAGRKPHPQQQRRMAEASAAAVHHRRCRRPSRPPSAFPPRQDAPSSRRRVNARGRRRNPCRPGRPCSGVPDPGARRGTTSTSSSASLALWGEHHVETPAPLSLTPTASSMSRPGGPDGDLHSRDRPAARRPWVITWSTPAGRRPQDRANGAVGRVRRAEDISAATAAAPAGFDDGFARSTHSTTRVTASFADRPDRVGECLMANA